MNIKRKRRYTFEILRHINIKKEKTDETFKLEILKIPLN